MKLGVYRNAAGSEIELQCQVRTAREFLIVGTVYSGVDHDAPKGLRDRLVTAEGLRRAGFKWARDS